uniref:Uncharacterized protein n=1 Tax=viral metagenome TaxID=1070528 RepID=A0A6C0EFA3_9ZZZZ
MLNHFIFIKIKMSILKIKEILDIQKFNKPIIILVIVFAITTIIIFVYNKTEKEEKFTNNQKTLIKQENDIENKNNNTLINKIQQHENNIKNIFLKEYDFMYIINSKNDDNNTNNNIIQKYIHIMCSKYKLNGLLIGTLNYNELPPECNMIDDKPINHLEKCRFLFVPYILKESETTILKDALSLNLPCLVMNNDDNNNPEYLEKLNYINEKTGKTFNNETDFEPVLGEFLSNFDTCTPRETFMG